MFRACLGVSLLLHIILISGLWFWLPLRSLSKQDKVYFEIYRSVPAEGKKEGADKALKDLPKKADNLLSMSIKTKAIASLTLREEAKKGTGDRENTSREEIGETLSGEGTSVMSEVNGQTTGDSVEGESDPFGEAFPSPDIPARKIHHVDPFYPFAAKEKNWEGEVVLIYKVCTDGTVGEVKITKSSGHMILDEEAVKAVKKWRYRPAEKEGCKVACFRRVVIKFVLE